MPTPIIPVPTLSTTDVLYGDRTTSYRWEVLTHSPVTGLDTLLGVLDGVSAASLSWNNNASVKGTGNMTVIDLLAAQAGELAVSQLKLESVRFRPVQVIVGLPENPLGVFLVSEAPEQWQDTGRTYKIELLDRCTVPSQDLTDSSFGVPAGTLILAEVQAILLGCGEAISIDNSNALVTSTDMVWPAGTSKLTIINNLLSAANYSALWVDGYGNFQTTPYVLPANRSLSYDLLGIPRELRDGEQGIYEPSWTRDKDNWSVPNKVVAVESGTGSAGVALIGSYVNTDPTSPYSTVTRGRTITYFLDSVDCPADTDANTVIFLNARAQSTLVQMSAVQAALQLSHLPIPIKAGDVIRFSNALAGIDHTHVVTQIDLDCTSTGLMKTSLQEVISL